MLAQLVLLIGDRRYNDLSALLELVRTRFPLLTSRLGDVRQLAAAGLGRCRRLTVAMDLQRTRGLGDTIGGQLRAVFETWAHSVWLLLDPDVAYPELMDAYRLQVGRLDRFAELGLPGVDGWEQCGRRSRDLYSVIHAFTPKLVSLEGPESAETAEASYHLIQRYESMRGAHGGLSSVLGHLHVDGLTVQLSDHRIERPGAPEAEVLLAAAVLRSTRRAMPDNVAPAT